MLKMDMTTIFLKVGVFCFIFLANLESTEAKCFAEVNELNLTIGNDHFKAVFVKGMGHSLTVNGKELHDKAGFFIDYTTFLNKEKKYRKFTPEKLTVVNNTDNFVHVYFSNHATNGLVTFEEHLIIQPDISGIYQYIVVQNTYGKDIKQGEIRMTWRMNSKILDKVDNGLVQVTPPSQSTIDHNSTNVWDSTWLLPNGEYYSKYDFARYVRETEYFGVLGNGYGVWTILPDHEFYSGGAQKQDLLSHQWGVMLMYLTGTHFGTPELDLHANFEKMYGPWLVYFNYGMDDASLAEDVKVQVIKEKAKWPYDFIQDTRYPLANDRGSVSGTVEGKKALVLVQPRNEVCEMQVQGYAYTTTTVNQTWSIKNVRPGAYKVCVYPLEGAAVGTMLENNVDISAGMATDAGTVEILEPANIIWQIGQANHRSSEFHYSNEKRNWGWHLKPPANLVFNVGKDNEADAWYYAQTNKGTWQVKFDDVQDNKNRQLWIGLAAASYTPQTKISINGHSLGSMDNYANDAACYRCAMQSGVYQSKKFSVPASVVLNGTNTLSIELDQGMLMYDTIVYITE